MATYVLIHGASSDSWYWHLVAPLLHDRGHDVVAPDLPCDDDAAGLAEYADTVVSAIGDRTDLIVVAQSLGSFTAPLICDRLPVELIVLVAAMVPKPGESPGEWWDNTGHGEAMRAKAKHDGRRSDGDIDPLEDFFHDVPPDIKAKAIARGEKAQSAMPFQKPWPMDAWPDVATKFLLSRDDRVFPAEFQRRVVRERLGITPDEMDGGHLPALHSPKELVERLEAYRTELGGS
jgi:pimeloyl-ACP methyl ester carboxylesterase